MICLLWLGVMRTSIDLSVASPANLVLFCFFSQSFLWLSVFGRSFMALHSPHSLDRINICLPNPTSGREYADRVCRRPWTTRISKTRVRRHFHLTETSSTRVSSIVIAWSYLGFRFTTISGLVSSTGSLSVY